MKKILVPIDFSKTAHDAYLYARKLAEKLEAELEVVHVYTGSFNTNEPIVLEPLKGREEVLLDRIQAFCGDLGDTSDEVSTQLKVEKKALQSMNPPNKLIKLSKETDLIVMGASGEHDLLEKLFGGVSSKVAQKAECPVLLIPKGATYNDPKRILYASNWESVQREFIEKVVKFGSNFGSGIDFVHVVEKSEKESFQTLENEIFNTLFKDKTPDFSFNLLETNGESPLKGLSNYATKESSDLIVLVNRQDGMLENIFGQSMTKEMAVRADFPILVYHM
jgi:nucleotide-binding universal stress UspA family protein